MLHDWPDKPKAREAQYARALFSESVDTQDWGLRELRSMGYVSVGCSLEDARRTVTKLRDKDGHEKFETREKGAHKRAAYKQVQDFEGSFFED